VRHSQNDGYVIAVDLNDKKSGGFTWVLRGNFTFINPMIPMSFKGQNQEVLLSGSKSSNFKKI